MKRNEKEIINKSFSADDNHHPGRYGPDKWGVSGSLAESPNSLPRMCGPRIIRSEEEPGRDED